MRISKPTLIKQTQRIALHKTKFCCYDSWSYCVVI